MADHKLVQKQLDGLPKNEPQKALQELTSWIESVSAEVSFRADYQFSVLRLLDETARPYEHKLSREYFAVKAPVQPHENRLWSVLDKFYLQVAQSCLVMLKRYRIGDKGATALQPDLPLIAARGISALAGLLKFAAARYAPVDHSVWEKLAEFYSAAQKLNYLEVPVAMYPGMHAKTSVSREFTSLLVWYAASSGTVNRIDGHLAQQLTLYLGKHFSVGPVRGPNCLLDFDLLHPSPPVREWASGKREQAGMLYIGVEGIQNTIADCIKTLEKNFIPEELNLNGNYEADRVRNVLRRLSACLVTPVPCRRSMRHKTKVNIRVVKGFSGLVDKIEPSLVFGTSSEEALWETDDISRNGFHAVLMPDNAVEVEIGAVLGTQPENIGYWGAGIVRRLCRDDQRNLHIGVELLSSRVYPVSLHKQDSSGSHAQSALWLKEENSGELNLLMPPQADFGVGSLKMRMDEKNFSLIPVALLEMGEDYDLARYRKVDRESE